MMAVPVVGSDWIAWHRMIFAYARLCHGAGGELEQVQFLLGHASAQTKLKVGPSGQELPGLRLRALCRSEDENENNEVAGYLADPVRGWNGGWLLEVFLEVTGCFGPRT